jgi:hypothetical protein
MGWRLEQEIRVGGVGVDVGLGLMLGLAIGDGDGDSTSTYNGIKRDKERELKIISKETQAIPNQIR